MDSKLDLIDLDQELPGQRRFISCWVSRSSDETFIVDPGPPATGDYLIARLEELGITRLDHILLTHIHLDHGGATAQVLDRWPDARVLCHKVGRPHLVDPTRLWEGSLQVLGRKAEVYGQPRPVPEAAIANDLDDPARGIRAIPTPGHAPHHVAFLHQGSLFAGEAVGTFSNLSDQTDAQDYYLRPATPPRFFLPVATDSLDRLVALEPIPERICFAHHGQFSGDVSGLLQVARDQLNLWVTTVKNYLRRETGGAVPADQEGLEDLFSGLAAHLQSVDPRFARGGRLPEDIQIREMDFTRQTLRGILGYLAASS